MALRYEPLSRDEVKGALHGAPGPRPPAFMHKWPGGGLREVYGEALDEVMAPYPDDIVAANTVPPGMWEAPEGLPANYRWAFKDLVGEEYAGGLDSGGSIIADWSELDAFIADLPDPTNPAIFEPVRQAVARAEGRYVLGWAWNYFYERLWFLRGMTNALMDFHLYPAEVNRLLDALLEFALKLVDGVADAGADAFASSNDLGHQTGLMMGPGPFREFLKPRLAALADAVHARGMDFWLHSCGDLTDVVGDMAELGLDCLHPIQYGAMDWEESARVMAGRMTAWAGADVQHVLPEQSPDGVRRHVRYLIDTFYRPGQGGLVVAAGNGIIPPTSLENIDAFLDETFRYGLAVGTA